MYYPKRKRVKEGPPAFEYFRKKSDAKAVAIIIVSSAICSCLLSLRLLQKRRREGVVNNARRNFNKCEGDSTGQKVIIIGGGASGSALAAQLTQQHPELYVTVIEHQARRVFTGCIPLAQVGIRSYDIMRVGVWDSLRSPVTWNITREADLVMGTVQKIDAMHKKVYVVPNEPELNKLKIDQLNSSTSSSPSPPQKEQELEGAQHPISTETRSSNDGSKYNTSAKIDSIGKSFSNRYANESRSLGLSIGSDYHNQEIQEESDEQEQHASLLAWKRVRAVITSTTSFISSSLPFLSDTVASLTEMNLSVDENNSYTVTSDGLHVYPYDVLVIAAGAERTLGALSSLLKYSDLDRNRVVVNPGPTRDTIVHAFASNIVYAKIPPLSFVAQMEALRHNTLKIPLSQEHTQNVLHSYSSLIKSVKSLLFDTDSKRQFDAKCINDCTAPYEGDNLMAIQIDGVLDSQAQLTIGNKSDMALRAITNPLECNNSPEQPEEKNEKETESCIWNVDDVTRNNNKNTNNNDFTYSQIEQDKNTNKCNRTVKSNNSVAEESMIDKYVAHLMHFASRQFEGSFISAVNLLWHFIEDHKRFAFTRLLCVSAESQPLSMGVSESVNNVIKSYWNELVNRSRKSRGGGGGGSSEQERAYPHFHFLSHSYITAIDTAHYTATLYNYLHDMYIVIPYNTLILDLPLRAPSFVRKSNLHRAYYVKEHILQPVNNSLHENNTQSNKNFVNGTFITNSASDTSCNNEENSDRHTNEWLRKRRLYLRRFLEYVYHDETNTGSAIQEQQQQQQQHEAENETHPLRQYKVIRKDPQHYKKHEYECNALHMPQRLEEMFADEMSFVDVDPQTLQHRQYDNIFAIGDVAGLPTLKSYASAQAQVPVVAHNVYQVLQCIREEHRRTNSSNNGGFEKQIEKSKIYLKSISCTERPELVKKNGKCKKSRLLFVDGRITALDAESHPQAHKFNSLLSRLFYKNRIVIDQNYYSNITNDKSRKYSQFSDMPTSSSAANTVEEANIKSSKEEWKINKCGQQNHSERTMKSLLTESQVSKNESDESLILEEELEEWEEEHHENNETNARVYDGYTSFMINMSMKQSMWPEFCYSDAQRVQFDKDRQVRLRSWLQNMDVKMDKLWHVTVPIISTANDINQLLFNNHECTFNSNNNCELPVRESGYNASTSENATQVMSDCDPYVIDSTSPLSLCNYHLWDNLKWQGIRGRANSYVQEWFLYELMHFFCFTRSLWHPQYWLRQPQYNDNMDGEIIPPQSSFLTSPLKYLHELL